MVVQLQDWLVELDEAPSNQLFEDLADWEHQLKHANIDFDDDFSGPQP